MEKQDYQKMSQYNITRYLQKCFDSGTEPDVSLMDNISFQEISKISVSYYLESEKRHIQFDVEETLAQNCMSNLPLSAYEKFVTADWLTYTKNYDSNLIGSLIYNRQDKLLQKLHDVGIKKATEDTNFALTYLKKFIDPMLQVSNNFQRGIDNNAVSSEFVDNYYSLVKKCFCELEFIRDSQFYNKKTKLKLQYKESPNWLSSSLSSKYSYNRKEDESVNELFQTLASRKEFSTMFEDAFGQLLKKHSKNEILDSFGITESSKNHNVLSTSLSAKNHHISSFLINSLGLSQQDAINAFDDNLTKYVDGFQYNSESSIKSFLNKYFSTNLYKENKNLFFPDFDSKFLPFFAISSHKTMKNDIINKKDKYFSQNIFDFENSNLNFFIKFTKTIQALDVELSNENKTIHWIKDRTSSNRPIAFHVAEFLINNQSPLLIDVSMQSVTKKEWEDISNKLLNNSQIIKTVAIIDSDKKKTESPLDHTKLEFWLKNYQMDCELNPSKNNNPSKIPKI